MIEANYDLKERDLLGMIVNKGFCKKLKIKSLEDFYDLCIFNLITSMDLDVIIDGYLNSKYDWQKRFYIRSMILVLNEHLEKIHSLMNSKFYNFISSSEIFNVVKDEIMINKSSYKELNRRKSDLYRMRNDVIGHRSKDAEIFLKSIENINSEEIYDLVLNTQIILNQFTQLSTKVIDIITNQFEVFYQHAKLQKL